MPVLLLARGDQESKALLRRAIEARYGVGPPVLETLKLQMKGRAQTKVGPVSTWVPLEIVAHFKFGFSARWDYTARPVGVAVTNGTEAFDGTTWYQRRGHDTIAAIQEVNQIDAIRARLWAMNALMLTPLGDHFVELRATGERSFDATHRDMGLTVRLQLKDDDTLEFVETECLNPDTGMRQTYSLRVGEGQSLISGIILPRKISFAWDKKVSLEVAPIAAVTNLTVDDSVFRLEKP